VPKVPKVKGKKITITCFGPVFIGLKMGFPVLSSFSSGNNNSGGEDIFIGNRSQMVNKKFPIFWDLVMATD